MKMLKFIACANEMVFDADESEPIRIPYGKWPYGMKTIEMPDGEKRQVFVTQEFARTSAEKVTKAVASSIAAGGLGMPIYEGHPDVPELAHKYPNKAAIGWVKEVAVGDDAARCRVEWLKFPGKGVWLVLSFFRNNGHRACGPLTGSARSGSIQLLISPRGADNNNSGKKGRSWKKKTRTPGLASTEAVG